MLLDQHLNMRIKYDHIILLSPVLINHHCAIVVGARVGVYIIYGNIKTESRQMYNSHISIQLKDPLPNNNIGVAAGPAGQVLAGPLTTFIQGKNETSFLQKASNEQKC